MLGAGLAKVVLNLELKGQCITGAPPRRPERRASARGRQCIQSGSALPVLSLGPLPTSSQLPHGGRRANPDIS